MTKTLPEALLAAQKNAPALQKDSINPHFGNKFVSLDSLLHNILPVLNDAGLVVTQWPTFNSELGRHSLVTRVTHAATGESVSEEMLLNVGKDDMQGLGSAITYARRYALTAVLGLSADVDDDANSAPTEKPIARKDTVDVTDGFSIKVPPNPNDDLKKDVITVKKVEGPNDRGYYTVWSTGGLKLGTNKPEHVADITEGSAVEVSYRTRKNGKFENNYIHTISVLPGELIDDIPFA